MSLLGMQKPNKNSMLKKNRIYWNGLEQLKNDPAIIQSAEHEFREVPARDDAGASSSSRRDFLKLMGFSIAAASLASC